MNNTLLVELQTEELPPKALVKLSESFGNSLFTLLQKNDFLEDGAALTLFATPRRLAVSITHVRAVSASREETIKLMPVSVGLDASGNPSASLLKKMDALGIAPENASQFEQRDDGKAKTLYYTRTVSGGLLSIFASGALALAAENLPVPKMMSYQRPDGSTVKFVRPVHALLALHGAEVLPLSLLGLQAGRVTRGHRFLSDGAPIAIAHADDYATRLEQGKVLAGAQARKERIRAQLLEQAGADQVLMPEALLDEVAALVEWPVVYACHFEDAFLAVPQECLILTMQTNQKYFALTDAAGKLRSRFLIVSNIATDDPRHIVGGNERVVRPRLSDAKFFFEQDQKRPLAARLPLLENVVYHNKLGTQAARTQRVTRLAGIIARQLGYDVALAERGAQLAKADLLTDMVGEFPELQGIMGTYYARHDGEPEEVALAASEHYQPRFAGDALPSTATGTAVALADKLETLVGIWSIGLQPTGEKDPFALRRHALGVMRMLLEKRLPLAVDELLFNAASVFDGQPGFKDPSAEVAAFMFDRLRGLLRERGFGPNEIEAVLDPAPKVIDDIVQRLEAVKAFAALPESASLAAANKRINNILKKTTVQDATVDTGLLQEDAERRLHAAVEAVRPAVEAAFAAHDFETALKTLARLRDDVDAYFNSVMVMADDPALRTNRLAQLKSLHFMMNRVADISKLAA